MKRIGHDSRAGEEVQSPDGSNPLVAGRYRLIRKIGAGNMSTVYEASDHHASGRLVALKLLDSQHPDALKRVFFHRETLALGRLEHPHIITLHDAGWAEERGCFYLALEYLPQTLQDVIDQHPDSHDQAWCWPLLRAMIDALVYAHSKGVIHRDIKTANILISGDGSAKLTDFGISHLKYELTQGTTVSSFYSAGFAAPEQVRGEEITERSDIYSLGCVYYHLLSRTPPPTTGVTPELVRMLGLPKVVQQLLLEMLAADPGGRIASAVLAQRRVELTRNLVPAPVIYLQLTHQARRVLMDGGFLQRNTNDEAVGFVQQELANSAQVYVARALHDSHDPEGTWRVNTDQLQLVCTRAGQGPLLIAKTIHLDYEPEMELRRSAATPMRFDWRVLPPDAGDTGISGADRAAIQATLDALGVQLADHAAVRDARRIQERARRDFVRTWQNVLAYQQQQLEQAPRLRYTAFRKAGGMLVFTIRDVPPDDLAWPDSAPMGVFEGQDDSRSLGVGHLVRLQGGEVFVTLDLLEVGERVDIERIPALGWLGVYQQEAAVALDRQRYALQLVRSGGTLNPDLPAVLMDLSAARFIPIDEELTYFHADLAEDKRAAVRQALATRDVFLLQGPPGTGKTTTLAEIILQIRRRTPNARILISSQSNVATDHILSRVAALGGRTAEAASAERAAEGGGDSLEIVRLGRPQKIGAAAQEWTLDQRVAQWREDVLSRTEPVLKELKRRIGLHRRTRSIAAAATDDLITEVQQCQELLAEVERSFAIITAQRRAIAAISSRERRGSLGDAAQQTVAECKRAIAARMKEIRETLDLIHACLPADVDDGDHAPAPTAENLADGEAAEESLLREYEQVSGAVARLLQQESEDTDAALLNLVNRWRRVFGRTPDFAEPIMSRAEIVAATCLIAGSHYLKHEEFDWAIIDEAGRATAPELLVPLVRARRAIIVGDQRQLPPMLDQQLDQKTLAQLGTTAEELGESLFAALAAQGVASGLPVVQMLTVQHRMHPAIGRLISAVFYDGALTHATTAEERAHHLTWIPSPVVWYTTEHLPQHAEVKQGTSFYNRAEITAIYELLMRMERSYLERDERREVAIITPYQAQIAELTATVMPQSQFWRALDIEIATVDAFQGRDRDIVIYSTVRSNETGRLGFLRDRRRLNVALSRARQLLVIVGDMTTLDRGAASAPAGRQQQDDNPYHRVVQYLRDHAHECSILPIPPTPPRAEPEIEEVRK